MPNYSFHNIIRRNSRLLANDQGLQLSAARELFSTMSGFANYHELTRVARNNPSDPRLMKAALGVSDLRDLVDEENIHEDLDIAAEEALSGQIAGTNAYMFEIENLEVINASYDDSTGIAKLRVAFEYSGEQDPDRVYSGSAFYVDATILLLHRNGLWKLIDGTEGLKINRCESDVDRDYT